MLSTQAAVFNQTGIQLNCGDFIIQSAMCLVGDMLGNKVDARRLNRYIYRAYCPKCNETNMLLGKVVVWHIVCEKCGHDFVALRAK